MLPVLGAFTDLVTVRIRVGMDTGAIPGYSKVIRVNQSKFKRRDNGNNGKQLLKGLFIVKRKFAFQQGKISDCFSNAGMTVRELFTITRLRRGLSVFMGRKQVFTCVPSISADRRKGYT